MLDTCINLKKIECHIFSISVLSEMGIFGTVPNVIKPKGRTTADMLLGNTQSKSPRQQTNSGTSEQPMNVMLPGNSLDISLLGSQIDVAQYMPVDFLEKYTSPSSPKQSPRRLQCEVCCKEFAQMATLVNHRRIHTGEKPFQCEMCLKTFRQRATLHNHRKTHLKMNPSEDNTAKELVKQEHDMPK
ncbi:unnamed protein product [Owenia fusiformis]|uniref:C2H2-type domain-containing protein n=1 Tax=Owenia fusiformis TaxID=6347 RepID=A0A8S4NAU5_OWEFU|nr:unnamed protein product [Owenia fusiformis]